MFKGKQTLTPLVNRLLLRTELTQTEIGAVLGLPHTSQALRAGEYLLREGDTPTHCCLMLSGFTFRNKIVADGGRQILGVHLPGDIVDLQNAILERADHNVQALTAAEVAAIPRAAVLELAFAYPGIAKTLWHETLVDGSIFREWIANVGRRDARQRISHLLCEFAMRWEMAMLGSAESFELPMTQEQIADAVGLTPVHVNRTLMALGNEQLIKRDKRSVSISDWKKLVQVADFDPAYLHLPTAMPGPLEERTLRMNVSGAPPVR